MLEPTPHPSFLRFFPEKNKENKEREEHVSSLDICMRLVSLSPSLHLKNKRPILSSRPRMRWFGWCWKKNYFPQQRYHLLLTSYGIFTASQGGGYPSYYLSQRAYFVTLHDHIDNMVLRDVNVKNPVRVLVRVRVLGLGSGLGLGLGLHVLHG
jgi:hypothetical protein